MSGYPFKTLLVLSFISLSLWLSDSFGLLSLPRASLENLTRPIAIFLYQTSGDVAAFIYPLTRPWRQQGEIDQLKKDLAQLATVSARMSQLEQENQALIKQSGVKTQPSKPLLMAHLIAHGRYLVIDQGGLDGVRVGQMVISGNILVGKVISTTPHQAAVILPVDPASIIPVWTKQLTKGVVKGSYGKTMILDEVLQNEPISQGEIVVTTGESGYSQNLVVALVGKIKSEPRDMFKKAQLQPLIDLAKLTSVFVLID